jgi:aminomethyltransferase
MPLPTAFHPRTSLLCESQEWREWAGYLAAATYYRSHEHEYYAIRSSAALIDVSPLFKYEIQGPQASELVNRIIPRDISKCSIGQVLYTPWCDDHGKVIDDGTVARLADDRFRITSAESNLAWFQDCGRGYQAEVIDGSDQLAVLAIQGPNSRKILRAILLGERIEELGFYRLFETRFGDIPVTISRTGYTGDLGYEVWVEPNFATQIWDLLMDAGSGYGLTPTGMVALDIARIEAGLLLIDVDYISSRNALIQGQKSSPYEIGLGWTVDLERSRFIGRKALADELAAGIKWRLIGLDIHWPSLEKEYGRLDLVPQVAGRASRSAIPVFHDGRQIGQATSHTFSPILKKYVAIASLESRFASPGRTVEIEITVEYVRRRAKATVVRLPFFNPPRKKA